MILTLLLDQQAGPMFVKVDVKVRSIVEYFEYSFFSNSTAKDLEVFWDDGYKIQSSSWQSIFAF